MKNRFGVIARADARARAAAGVEQSLAGARFFYRKQGCLERCDARNAGYAAGIGLVGREARWFRLDAAWEFWTCGFAP